MLFDIKKFWAAFDSPIFCETVASFRMEKFEKLKKKMFYEIMSKLENILVWCLLFCTVFWSCGHKFGSNGLRSIFLVAKPMFLKTRNQMEAT